MSSDGREELRARVRVEEPSPDAAVVIRGGPDTLSLLQSHARRLNRLYVLDGAEVFGISVFVARDEIGPTSESTILSSKVRNYAEVYRTNVSTLKDAGFVLLPTFSAPHFTVLMSSLEAADDLAAAFGNLVVNPYAEGREEER
jgi:hypothetical protein